jgi:hypothetical protein
VVVVVALSRPQAMLALAQAASTRVITMRTLREPPKPHSHSLRHFMTSGCGTSARA